jgi:hypothetical protein
MQTRKVEVRPDAGQATSSNASTRPIRRFGCRHSQMRSNFLAARLDQTENRRQQPGDLGKCRLRNQWEQPRVITSRGGRLAAQYGRSRAMQTARASSGLPRI